MSEHLETGLKGEREAVNFLTQNGYQILEKNWRTGKFEIDIIAKISDIIVIAEVKTRTGTFFQEPFEAVTRKKQKFLIEAANAYIEINKLDLEVRFDIISIVYNNGNFKIFHIIDAFYPLV
jgi:putative endonuclease